MKTQVSNTMIPLIIIIIIIIVMIQRYNAVAILGTFANTTPEDEF